MANAADILARLQEAFSDALRETAVARDGPVAVVDKARLLEVCRFLRDDEELRCDHLADLCGADYPEREDRFEVVYHLYSLAHHHRVRLKVRAAEGEAVPTLTPLWIGAEWPEREVYDLFGVPFEGHPDLRRLFLPDDWEGHPLRKDHERGGEVVDFALPSRTA
jgi:NADH-quinone oxidoreductase subunit C